LIFGEKYNTEYREIDRFVPFNRLAVDYKSLILDPTLEFAVADFADLLPFLRLEVAHCIDIHQKLPRIHGTLRCEIDNNAMLYESLSLVNINM
jgi:hypothetical protein